jgi:plastocyanin
LREEITVRACFTTGHRIGVIVAAAVALAAGHTASAGGPVVVEVHHSSFSVASLVPGQGTPHGTVQLGDVVRWVWMSTNHSVTSDLELFDSGIHSMPFQFEHTFSQLGTFPYHCVIHGAPGGLGMAGSITVVPAPGVLTMVGAGMLLASRRRR